MSLSSSAQDSSIYYNNLIAKSYSKNNVEEKDIKDIYLSLRHRKKKLENITDNVPNDKVQITALPAAGYTLQTGFAGILFGNVAFYTEKERTDDLNLSSVTASVTYSQYKQIIIPILTNIWTKNNEYNISCDWRYLKFPSYTYGLGGFTTESDQYSLDYSSLRLHETILRSIGHNMFVGAGLAFDYIWNIKEINPPTSKQSDYEKYGFTKHSLSSGITATFQYDDRKNSINPIKGNYVNVNYRYDGTVLGSDANWSSVQVDMRKYIQFPNNSANTIALWSYDWFTFGGNAPYLLLPFTGGDPASNSGRGYIQGRFRSKSSLYFESEYRFNVTRNSLIGGVAFANLQSVTELVSNRFEAVAPGYGLGIRVKLNKYSRTNLAIDYGWGINGSKGFFVNLGEVF